MLEGVGFWLIRLLWQPFVWLLGKAVCPLTDLSMGLWHRAWKFRSPDKFLILIASIAHDDKAQTHTRAVMHAFTGNRSVARYKTCKKLNFRGASEEDEERAKIVGRRWLRRHRGDLLIWGEVAQQEKALRIWFVPRMGEVSFQRSQFVLQMNELGDDFQVAARERLFATAIAAIRPITDKAGASLVEILIPLMSSLKNLIENEKSLTELQIAELYDALGVVRSTISYQTSDRALLQNAIRDFQSAVDHTDPGASPRLYAAALHHLGEGYLTEGAIYLESEKLKASLKFFDDALAINLPAEPNSRLRTIKRKAEALALIGHQAEDAGPLEAAIVEIENALFSASMEVPKDIRSNLNRELTKAKGWLGALRSDVAAVHVAASELDSHLAMEERWEAPIEWAYIKNIVGCLLRSIDELQPEISVLERAIEEFRVARDAISPQLVPGLWAALSSNIGGGLVEVGLRTKDLDLVEEGIDYLNLAIENCPVDRAPISGVHIRMSLANAVVRLDELMINAGPADAYIVNRSVISVSPSAETDWVTTARSVNEVYSMHEKIELSIGRLRKALSNLEEVEGMVEQKAHLVTWQQLHSNKAALLARLAERTADPAVAAAAVQTVEAFVQSVDQSNPTDWARAQLNRGAIMYSEALVRRDEAMINRSIDTLRGAVSASRVTKNGILVGQSRLVLGSALTSLQSCRPGSDEFSELESLVMEHEEECSSLSSSIDHGVNRLRGFIDMKKLEAERSGQRH